MSIDDDVRLLLRYCRSDTRPYQVPPNEHEAVSELVRPGTLASTLGSAVLAPPPQLGQQHNPQYVWRGSKPPELNLEEVIPLRVLYTKTPESDRPRFLTALLRPYYFNFQDEDVQVAQAVAHVLMDIGRVDLLPEFPGSIQAQETLWRSVAEKLIFEHARFSDADLGAIEEARRRSYHAMPRTSGDSPLERTIEPSHMTLFGVLLRVEEIVSRVRYLRLRDELLRALQPDLEQDRRTLETRRKELDLNPQLDEALNHIDVRMSQASKPLDYKECMDMLRAFFEKFIKEVSRTAATIVPNVTDRSGETFQLANQSLVKAGLLTESESNVTQKFYSCLSIDGVHTLGTPPEQVRVLRTTTIEWSMMIAGRLKALREKLAAQRSPAGTPPALGPSAARGA